jgi:hypothetical protein
MSDGGRWTLCYFRPYMSDGHISYIRRFTVYIRRSSKVVSFTVVREVISHVELGVRVYPIFRVGFYGFFIFRVLNI